MNEDSAQVLEPQSREQPGEAGDLGLRPTPTDDDLPRRFSDFATMPEALDYAATGL